MRKSAPPDSPRRTKTFSGRGKTGRRHETVTLVPLATTSGGAGLTVDGCALDVATKARTAAAKTVTSCATRCMDELWLQPSQATRLGVEYHQAFKMNAWLSIGGTMRHEKRVHRSALCYAPSSFNATAACSCEGALPCHL